MTTFRFLSAALLLLASVVPASADPRLVRVIWDVAHNTVLYRVETVVDVGASHFEVPNSLQEALDIHFVVPPPKGAFLRKGDRVRVVVVNFNAASHAWHDSSNAEFVPLETSPVGPFISAALLAITGAHAFPAVNMLEFKSSIEPSGKPGPTDKGDACDPIRKQLATMLGHLRTQTLGLLRSSAAIVSTAGNVDLAGTSDRLSDVAAGDAMWRTFDNALARNVLQHEVDFPLVAANLAPMVAAFDEHVRAFNDTVLAFDLLAIEHPACAKTEADDRNALVGSVAELSKDSAPLKNVLTTLRNAAKAWDLLAGRLRPDWSLEAVEMVVKGTVPAESVLRIDVVFSSTDKTVNRRIQRSLVLPVEPWLPALTISTGIGYHWLPLKELGVTQGVGTNSDGITAAKAQLIVVDDPDWSALAPVWLQSIRVLPAGKGGIYGTFGTTPDRNIFQNLIAGGSYVRPDWRTTFTFAVVAARGYEAKDLDPVIARFSDANGFALPDFDKDALPLPDARWVMRPMFAVTFNMASF